MTERGLQDLVDQQHHPMRNIELLHGNDQFQCDICQKKTDATRQVVATRAPPYLTVQLNRFAYSKTRHQYAKLLNPVTIGDDLRLPVSNGNADSLHDAAQVQHVAYRLVSVVVHSGPTMQNGHYYSLVRARETEQWFVCDDSHVELLDPTVTTRIFSGQGGTYGPQDKAYLLMFERRPAPVVPQAHHQQYPQQSSRSWSSG